VKLLKQLLYLLSKYKSYPKSSTKKATKIVVNAARKAGGNVEIIHLADFPLPIFDCRKDKTTYPENVHTLIQKTAEADGIILASPEYQGRKNT
jgi:multimeric flavodoxin WrbA